ncbi:Bestrophin, RFP-TM, chloride channel-domain-containing protein [Pseudoneurospora amorphoporcata]|uniref:Bestrophin, RFP-TM, chloride channel-domain-containing protein n=1 Tax=Pseudoneurospora amorphoporcata TaxID=241081 RepID=A0AAN6SHP4_9PEZI|nr:Bestrophin, RFP-TM, chloride channel-domain-containing protein [Pseudoneurospora amorphoporcata]
MSIQQPQSSIPTAVEPPGPNHNRLGSSGTSPTTTTTTMDDGGHVGSSDDLEAEQQHLNGGAEKPRLPRLSVENLPELDQVPTLMSPRVNTMNPFRPVRRSVEIDDYFTGPRDTQKHSKWPIFMQMHGSILPKMILPLFGVGAWTTMLTVINFKVTNLGIHNILLTVLGFVVGLGLSFRSSTAYERYSEGRKYWSSLLLACQTLGRVYWVHAKEREGELGKKDVLAKLTALNLLVAFAVSLKHRLRFEPYTCYDDISHLVAHLDTFAKRATEEEPDKTLKALQGPGFFKSVGEYIGVSFAASNPRKMIKKASRPLGNLPLEILSYLATYTDELIAEGQLPVPMQQTLAYNNMSILNDVLVGTDRVLSTPLPIAYAIAIAQITWVYILLLPFQLLPTLNWITIPATIAAAYIILGLLFIGREIENPFGRDVNDLPLESYCAQIAADMDIIASRKKMTTNADWIENIENKPLWPLSNSGWHVWMNRGEESIREAVSQKLESNFETRKERDKLQAERSVLERVRSKVTACNV